jgi:hypothetical protein
MPPEVDSLGRGSHTRISIISPTKIPTEPAAVAVAPEPVEACCDPEAAPPSAAAAEEGNKSG